jgi:hypothetical protein
MALCSMPATVIWRTLIPFNDSDLAHAHSVQHRDLAHAHCLQHRDLAHAGSVAVIFLADHVQEGQVSSTRSA